MSSSLGSRGEVESCKSPRPRAGGRGRKTGRLRRADSVEGMSTRTSRGMLEELWDQQRADGDWLELLTTRARERWPMNWIQEQPERDNRDSLINGTFVLDISMGNMYSACQLTIRIIRGRLLASSQLSVPPPSKTSGTFPLSLPCCTLCSVP